VWFQRTHAGGHVPGRLVQVWDCQPANYMYRTDQHEAATAAAQTADHGPSTHANARVGCGGGWLQPHARGQPRPACHDSLKGLRQPQSTPATLASVHWSGTVLSLSLSCGKRGEATHLAGSCIEAPAGIGTYYATAKACMCHASVHAGHSTDGAAVAPTFLHWSSWPSSPSQSRLVKCMGPSTAALK